MKTLLITGLGRSGSTIIQKVLSAHPEISISDESWHYFRAAQSYANRNARVLMGMTDAQYAHCLMSHVSQLYSHAIKDQNVQFYGDKCPPAFTRLEDIKLLLNTIDHPLKIIWTVRHPYDQAISWIERFQNNALAELSIYGQPLLSGQVTIEQVVESLFNIWIEQQKAMVLNTGHVIVYEEVTTEPQKTLKNLHDWLELTFQQSQLDSAFDGAVIGGDPKFNNTKHIHTASRFRYLNAPPNVKNVLKTVAARTNIITYFDTYGYKSL